MPILYSPLHLMHIQRTCPFLPEIEALIDLSMQTADTESDNVHLESLFHDQQELLEHQNRALSYALEHGMQEICEKYLFSVKDYFNNVSYPRVLRLLNSAMISPFKPN